jgi:hypothetical protein
VRDRENSKNLVLNLCEPPPTVLEKNPYLNRKFDPDPTIDLLPIELLEMSQISQDNMNEKTRSG